MSLNDSPCLTFDQGDGKRTNSVFAKIIKARSWPWLTRATRQYWDVKKLVFLRSGSLLGVLCDQRLTLQAVRTKGRRNVTGRRNEEGHLLEIMEGVRLLIHERLAQEGDPWIDNQSRSISHPRSSFVPRCLIALRITGLCVLFPLRPWRDDCRDNWPS